MPRSHKVIDELPQCMNAWRAPRSSTREALVAAVGWIPALGGKSLLLEILNTSVEEGRLEQSWELPPLCLTSTELEGTV